MVLRTLNLGRSPARTPSPGAIFSWITEHSLDFDISDVTPTNMSEARFGINVVQNLHPILASDESNSNA